MNIQKDLPKHISPSAAKAFYGRSHKMSEMSDREIVEKLIERDAMVTHWFLYVKCRPLFMKLISKLFNHPVEYDEFANEVAVLLLENNEYRLRQFDYKSSICLWLRTCLIRYFIRNNDVMIEDRTKESPYNIMPETSQDMNEDEVSRATARFDIETLLNELAKINPRHAYVIRRVMLEDAEFDVVAEELNIQVSNLYNIKKRAIKDLSCIALNRIK